MYIVVNDYKFKLNPLYIAIDYTYINLLANKTSIPCLKCVCVYHPTQYLAKLCFKNCMDL